MPDTHQDETAARTGTLYLLLAAGAVPIVVSAFDNTHWTTFSRWYALPTAAVVAGRFFFGWFRSLVWRVVGAGALYLAVAALCSAVIAWWNWMAFVAIAVLGTLLARLLGRHAVRLLADLGSEGAARLKRAWGRWRVYRKQDRTGRAGDSVPVAAATLSSSESDGTDAENEPGPGEGASSDRGNGTTDERPVPRSRLGRLVEP